MESSLSLPLLVVVLKLFSHPLSQVRRMTLILIPSNTNYAS